MIQAVSELVTDFPEIAEVDLNPVLAAEDGATAVDARFIVDVRGGARAAALRAGGDPRRR